jgi:farnesyl-diphosphate farnesyltransferase
MSESKSAKWFRLYSSLAGWYESAGGAALVSKAERFCRLTLSAVSRTFALNIPVLPAPLDFVVSVAYLLCRIADTIEDETQGTAADRALLLAEFAQLCELPRGWRVKSKAFAKEAPPRLRAGAPSAEIGLLRGTPLVLQALSQLAPLARSTIARCIQVMTKGMSELMRDKAKDDLGLGLADVDQMMTYCYYVAGVVGEMLTELFAGFSPRIEPRSKELVSRAPSFGRALQLTNILRDAREDLDQGRCFLPRREMAKHGLSAETLLLPERRREAVALFDELIAVARREADVALEYTLTIPPEEQGIRLFCLWPLFFAVLTLRELEGNPAVLEPTPIKIRRDTVQRVMAVTRSIAASDEDLRAFYRTCTSQAQDGISTNA